MPRIVAICTARDEADIIERSVSHLLAQGAHVIVADNLSTDATGLIAATCGATVIVDSDPAHRQSEKMTALAARFADPGDWVVPFDADEEWSGLANLTDRHDVAPVHPVVQIPDGDGWRDGPQERYPKVAFRWNPDCVIEEGNHGVRGAGSRVLDGALTVRHFQYRSLEQVKRKVRQGSEALDAAGMPYSTGQHWRELAKLDDEQLERWWQDYTASPR